MSTWTTEDRIEAQKLTAYELAEIMEIHDGSQVWNHGLEIATMLRQQADQIEQLKKEFDAMVMSFETRLATRGYEIQIKDQAARIAELEKLVSEMKYEKSSGVYTHPVKQLSDEEIKEICEKTGVFFDGVDTYRFARAIIKEITE